MKFGLMISSKELSPLAVKGWKFQHVTYVLFLQFSFRFRCKVAYGHGVTYSCRLHVVMEAHRVMVCCNDATIASQVVMEIPRIW